jgi:hypothetical protein
MDLVLCGVIRIAGGALAKTSGTGSAKPNILFIFADDLDFEKVGALVQYGEVVLAGEAPTGFCTFHLCPVQIPRVPRIIYKEIVGICKDGSLSPTGRALISRQHESM